MPMTWDAAADAKLLAAILKVYNVKTGAEGLKEVAAIMGPDCTAKACTHRIAKIREMAGGGGNASPTKTRTPSKPRATPVKKTPNSKKKKGGDSSDISDNETAEATPATSRSKRAGTKRNYADLNGGDSDSESGASDNSDDANYGEGGEGLNKKVKIEVGEDIGEGLRAGAEDTNDYTF